MAALSAERRKILSALSIDSGLTTRWVADVSGVKFGHNQRTTSAAVRSWLVDMRKDGLVSLLDDQKPDCWCITDAGRTALKAGDAG